MEASTRTRFDLHRIAALVAAMFFCGCTSESSIDSECAAHPVVLPAQPLRTEGYYAAAETLMGEPVIDWAARALLQRGFAYVETDGRLFGSVAGQQPSYVRLRLGSDEAECAAMRTYLLQMPDRGVRLAQRLSDMGLRPSECLVVEPRAALGARYRLHARNLSPARHWYDGLTARYLNRIDYRLGDARAGDNAPPLAHVRSVTLSYQVTVSGYPVHGCGRANELARLQADLLQPLQSRPARLPVAVVAAAPAPFARNEERPLEVLAQQAGMGSLDWRERRQLQISAPPTLPGVGVSGAQGWTLRLPDADDRWHAIPLEWIRERTEAADEAQRMHFDQPVWILRNPDGGVALFVIWRRAFRHDQGIARLTYAQYGADGAPLRRIEAPLPLAPEVNPFEAHFGLPQWDGASLKFRVTELSFPEDGDPNRHRYQVVRVSDYRWNLAD